VLIEVEIVNLEFDLLILLKKTNKRTKTNKKRITMVRNEEIAKEEREAFYFILNSILL
jgi:hypothetical protein